MSDPTPRTAVRRALRHGNCPEPLRLVAEAWLNNDAPGAELVEASYHEALNHLDAYRHKALPTPPDGVARYRALSRDEREEMTPKKRLAILDRHAGFLASECRIKAENLGTRLGLDDLLRWALAKPLAPSIVQAIRSALWTHGVANP